MPESNRGTGFQNRPVIAWLQAGDWVVMENIEIRRPEIELAAAVGGVRSLVRFAEKTNKTRRPDLDAAIYDALREAIHEASQVRDMFRKFLNAPNEYQTDERLTTAIATIDLILHKAEPLFRDWERAPIKPPQRLVNQVEILAEIVDDFRNLQETLALGRNVAFQEEIIQAKREAALR